MAPTRAARARCAPPRSAPRTPPRRAPGGPARAAAARRAPPPPPIGGGGGGGGDDEDDFFLDDEAAAKLRRILARKGGAGLVDAKGQGLVPLERALEGGGGSGAGGQRQQQQQPQQAAWQQQGRRGERREEQRDEWRDGAEEGARGGRRAQWGEADDGPEAGPRRRLFDAADASARPPRGGAGRGGGGADARWDARGPQQGGRGGRTAAAPAADIPVVRTDQGPDKGTFFSGRSWGELGASPEVAAALKSIGINRPSHVQVGGAQQVSGAPQPRCRSPPVAATRASLVLPQPPPPCATLARPPPAQAESYAALRDPATRHVALADQAGSGKTLAYLLPLLQELREQEAAGGGAPCTVAGSPRVLVLTPTVGEHAGLGCGRAAAAGEKSFRVAAVATPLPVRVPTPSPALPPLPTQRAGPAGAPRRQGAHQGGPALPRGDHDGRPGGGRAALQGDAHAGGDAQGGGLGWCWGVERGSGRGSLAPAARHRAFSTARPATLRGALTLLIPAHSPKLPQAGVDVVIATPGRAVALLDKGALSLTATRAVVLDEVDVLCGAARYRGSPSGMMRCKAARTPLALPHQI
jgi:hypothetical protein